MNELIALLRELAPWAIGIQVVFLLVFVIFFGLILRQILKVFKVVLKGFEDSRDRNVW